MEVKVAIYENQRYSAIGGWGAGHLLPTDRKRYSSADGLVGFATLDELQASITCVGWSPLGPWAPDGGSSFNGPIAEEAWRYGGSFNGVNESGCDRPLEKRGNLDFVRRRAMYRIFKLTGVRLHSPLLTGCGQMDIECVEAAAEVLLGGLSRLSLLNRPKADGASTLGIFFAMHLSAAKLELYEAVGILQEVTDDESWGHAGTAAGADVDAFARMVHGMALFLEAEDKASSEGSSEAAQPAEAQEEADKASSEGSSGGGGERGLEPSAFMVKTKINLEEFLAKRQAAVQATFSLATRFQAAASLTKSKAMLDEAAALAVRRALIAQEKLDASLAGFGRAERLLAATRLVGLLDPAGGAARCGETSCAGGAACPFAITTCPHPGCGVRVARRHRRRHDGLCEQKPVPCEHGCGELVPRRKQSAHWEIVCPLAPCKCPFSALGCIESLTKRAVAAHVETASHAHLLLALTRITDHQQVIANLNARVATLEACAASADAKFEDLAAGLVAAETSAAAHVGLADSMGKDLGALSVAHAAQAKKLDQAIKVADAADAKAKGAASEASKAAKAQASLAAAVVPAVRQLQTSVAVLSPNPAEANRKWKKV